MDLGINSFKFFLAYENVFMVNDKEFYQGLKQCAKLRALARVHAENGSVISEKQKELLCAGVTGPEGEQPQPGPIFLKCSVKGTHSRDRKRYKWVVAIQDWHF